MSIRDSYVEKGPTLFKKKAAALGAGALAAVATAGLTMTPVSATETSLNTAYAAKAEGLVGIESTPYLDSSEGYQREQLANADLAPLLDVGLLRAEVGENYAKAKVTDLKLLGGLNPANLPSELAELPTELVDTLKQLSPGSSEKINWLLHAGVIKAECEDGEGSAHIAGLKLPGELQQEKVEVTPPPNTEIPVPGVLEVTLNKQVTNEDGSLTVTGVSIDLLEGTQTIDLSSVTCSAGVGEDNGDDGKSDDKGDDGDKGDGPIEAPEPDPIRGHHAVTG